MELRQATCPANTPQSTPLEVDVSFPAGKVVGIGIVVPYGHAFLTGLAIAQAHQIVIPRSGTSWFVSDDERLTFDYHDQLMSGGWSVFTYNTDIVNPHTWYLRFFVQELTPAEEAKVANEVTATDLIGVAASDVSTPSDEGTG